MRLDKLKLKLQKTEVLGWGFQQSRNVLWESLPERHPSFPLWMGRESDRATISVIKTALSLSHLGTTAINKWAISRDPFTITGTPGESSNLQMQKGCVCVCLLLLCPQDHNQPLLCQGTFMEDRMVNMHD